MYTTKMLIDFMSVQSEVIIGAHNRIGFAEKLMYEHMSEILKRYTSYIDEVKPISNAEDNKSGYDIILKSGDCIIIMIKKEEG